MSASISDGSVFGISSRLAILGRLGRSLGQAPISAKPESDWIHFCHAAPPQGDALLGDTIKIDVCGRRRRRASSCRWSSRRRSRRIGAMRSDHRPTDQKARSSVRPLRPEACAELQAVGESQRQFPSLISRRKAYCCLEGVQWNRQFALKPSVLASSSIGRTVDSYARLSLSRSSRSSLSLNFK